MDFQELPEAWMNTQVRYKTAAPIPAAPPRAAVRAPQPEEAVGVALTAAILTVRAGEPVVAVIPVQQTREESLPCGPFCPGSHGTLEGGVRAWVRAETGVEIGFLQQLGASAGSAEAEPIQATVSVSYLALVGPAQCGDRTPAGWRSWYNFFPWEDWRHGRPDCLGEILRRLEAWAAEVGPPCAASAPAGERRQRFRMAFGAAGAGWDEERVLDRYELLQEAGLVGPCAADGAVATPVSRLVHPMLGDHASVLARAIGEFRRAVKRRPVVFELMPDEFTLFELQRTVEAVLGPHLHKQNFRRMVEGGGLVEPTGEHRLRTGGRPARLYRFRPDVLWERTAPGVRVKAGRA
jgi:hypothetical protein